MPFLIPDLMTQSLNITIQLATTQCPVSISHQGVPQLVQSPDSDGLVFQSQLANGQQSSEFQGGSVQPPAMMTSQLTASYLTPGIPQQSQLTNLDENYGYLTLPAFFDYDNSNLNESHANTLAAENHNHE